MKRKTRQQDKFEEEEHLKVRTVTENLKSTFLSTQRTNFYLLSVIEIYRENFQFYVLLT